MQPKINFQKSLNDFLSGIGTAVVSGLVTYFVFEKNLPKLSWGSDLCKICDCYERTTYNDLCDYCADDVREEFNNECEENEAKPNLSMYN